MGFHLILTELSQAICRRSFCFPNCAQGATSVSRAPAEFSMGLSLLVNGTQGQVARVQFSRGRGRICPQLHGRYSAAVPALSLSGLPLGRPSAFPSSSKVALPLRGERTFSLPSLNCCVSFQMLTPSARASPPPDHLRFRSLHHFNVTCQIS